MVLGEKTIEALVAKYIRDNMVLAFGTSAATLQFIKLLALKIEEEGINVKVVATSRGIAAALASLGIPLASINDDEIDIAIEFVDQVDKEFNYIKRDSSSFVRDKMVAQSADDLIVIAEEKNYRERLHGWIPFEICIFGWKRTVLQLQKLGEAKLRLAAEKPFRTETNHFVVDVNVDEIYSLEELEQQAKDVPGVLETGLFIGYADRILLHNGKLQMLSRLDYSKQDRIDLGEKQAIAPAPAKF